MAGSERGSRRPSIPADLGLDPGLSFDPERSRLGIGPTAGMDTVQATLAEPVVARVGTLGASRPNEESLPRRRRRGAGFELVELIARGGLGEVWLARQRSLERLVAVKRVRQDRLERGSGGESTGRLELLFDAEALVTASLEHPNIVPVYELGVDDEGRPLLGMKRVEGEPWQELLERDRGASLEERLERHVPILIDVVEAVAYAHSRGVIHRDLKPAQVLIGRFGEVLLVDWGLAARVAVGPTSTKIGDPGVTSSPAGTPLYMAPEQTLDDPTNLGPWTDVYLLGGLLHTIVSGRAPHHAPTAAEAFELASRGVVVRRNQDPAPPRALADLLEQTLDPAIEVRKALSAVAFAQVLRDWSTGAAQRREAEVIRTAVAGELERAADYSALRRLVVRLEGARRLRPDLPGLEELELELAVRLARAALVRGDLALARTELERLPESTATAEVLVEVERAESTRTALARQRRIAVLASAALVVLLLIGVLAFATSQRRAAARLAAERDQVARARASAETLASVMLEDLQTGLQHIGRLDLLEPVARAAFEHYLEVDAATLDRAGRRRQAMSYGAIAEVLLDRGDLAGARAARIQQLARAESLVEDRAEGETDRLGEWLVAVDAAVDLAAVERDLGATQESLLRFAEARELLHHAEQELGRHLELERHAVDLEDHEGVTRYDLGELAAALALFERAAERADAIARETGASSDLFAISGPRSRVGVVLADLGRLEEALAAFELAKAAARRALADGLDAAEQQLGFIEMLAGAALVGAGRFEQAVDALGATLERGRAWVAADPRSSERRYGLANVLWELSRAHAARGEKERARALRLELLEVAEPVRGEAGLRYLDDLVVRCLVELDRIDEARPLVESLLAEGWKHRGFEEYARRAGL